MGVYIITYEGEPMSLYVIAYRNLTLMNPEEIIGEDEGEDWVRLYPDAVKYPQQSEGYLYKGGYRYDDKITRGNYSGYIYRNWRDAFSYFLKQSGNNETINLLVNFSDCYGVIGPQCSRLIANSLRDFLNWQTINPTKTNQIHQRITTELLECFEYATKNGAVVFC